MKLSKRQCIILFMALLAALLSLGLLLLAPEAVLTGYSVVNGVKTVRYVPRSQAALLMPLLSWIMGLVWNWIAGWNEKKRAREPELVSLRIRGAVINVLFFLWMGLPMAFAFYNIFLGIF